MQVTLEKHMDVALVTLEGRIDAISSTELESQLAALLEAQERKLLLDLAAVEYISSAGLRVLLSTFKKLAENGGRMNLAAVQESVLEIMDVVGFLALFRIFRKREDALEDLAQL